MERWRGTSALVIMAMLSMTQAIDTLILVSKCQMSDIYRAHLAIGGYQSQKFSFFHFSSISSFLLFVLYIFILIISGYYSLLHHPLLFGELRWRLRERLPSKRRVEKALKAEGGSQGRRGRGQEGMIAVDIRGGKGESLDITLTADLVTCISAAEICTATCGIPLTPVQGNQDGPPRPSTCS